METLKIQVTKTTSVIEEQEISLPAYRKNDKDFYKVISDKEVLNVCHFMFGANFYTWRGNDVAKILGYEESSEEEFLKACKVCKGAMDKFLDRVNEKEADDHLNTLKRVATEIKSVEELY